MAAPSWATDLVDQVMKQISPDLASGVWNYLLEGPGELETDHQLSLYPTPYEIEGGRDDGACAIGGFELNVCQLLKLFDPLLDVLWLCGSEYQDLEDGPRFLVAGVYQQQRVTLRIYMYPCVEVDATTIYNVVTDQVRERDIRQGPAT